MARSLSYADAAVLLGGGPKSRLVTALDRLAGGALLAVSATGVGLALSLFDAKSELLRLSSELVTGLSEKLRGASRITRTERLGAANAVITVTALFEAMCEIKMPFDLNEAELTVADQASVAAGAGSRSGTLASVLVRWPVPVPVPDRPYEQTLVELSDFYRDRTGRVLAFLNGLAAWECMSETDRHRSEQLMYGQVPARAVRIYEEAFRRLAGEFPEFAFWANLVDHQATRAEIRGLRTALAGLAADLSTITTGRAADPVRVELARAHQAVLRRPVLQTDRPTGDLSIPTVRDCYINPDFRGAMDVPAESVVDRGWWSTQPRRCDLQQFLVGFLTNPAAHVAPLLVLGQPGSGKSLLTQVLAARLPPEDFLTVRVPLREVTADADLQTQIEQAIRATTGESLTWPQLIRTAEGALPVVLFDGFDELLQATGMSQSNFLEKIAIFQQREADQQRPVAVLVTSRISVADRARPVQSMTTVLLEPFDDEQVSRWLRVWNDSNAAALAARGLSTLSADTVLAHPDLARQPLLLLMLALHDTDGNPLQRQESALNQAELYERLLTSFARREVQKSGADLPDDKADQAVDNELLALSVVAFAMFNRQQQWVSEPNLDADLAALLPADSRVDDGGEPFAALTTAQLMVGRFYFVHVAQAVRDKDRLRTFEFLHATFGEFLIARLVVNELVDLTKHNVPMHRGRPRMVEDSFLHALLSFAPLTTRTTVISFIEDLMWLLSIEDRERIAHLALRLFHLALEPRRNTSLDAYRPTTAASVPFRHAAYSANLCLLIAIAAGQVTSAQLFPGRADHADDWIMIARLWQSQLPVEGWRNLVHELTVTRSWYADHRQVIVSFRTAGPISSEPAWTANFHPGAGELAQDQIVWAHQVPNDIRAEAAFLCDPYQDTLIHALEPLLTDLELTLTSFHTFGQPPMSAARALITLWLASAHRKEPDVLAAAAADCLQIATEGFGPIDTARSQYERVVLRHLVNILQLLPEEWPDVLMDAIADAKFDHKTKQELGGIAADLVVRRREANDN